jgi:hypothetical protein
VGPRWCAVSVADFLRFFVFFAATELKSGNWQLSNLSLVTYAGFKLETENLKLTPLARSDARSRRPHPAPPWPGLP